MCYRITCSSAALLDGAGVPYWTVPVLGRLRVSLCHSAPAMEERSRAEERWSEYLHALYQEKQSLEGTPHALAAKLVEQGE